VAAPVLLTLPAAKVNARGVSWRLSPGTVLFGTEPAGVSLPFTSSCASTRHIFPGSISCGLCF
jgi:hypothetical protein